MDFTDFARVTGRSLTFLAGLSGGLANEACGISEVLVGDSEVDICFGLGHSTLDGQHSGRTCRGAEIGEFRIDPRGSDRQLHASAEIAGFAISSRQS
jgi:hypothetical protein